MTIEFEMFFDYIGLGIVFGITFFLLIFILYNKNATEKIGKGMFLLIIICFILLISAKSEIPIIEKIQKAWTRAGG